MDAYRQFIHACELLEIEGPLSGRLEQFTNLLKEQNQTIETYKEKYQQ